QEHIRRLWTIDFLYSLPRLSGGYVNLLYDGVDNEKAEIERQTTARRVRATRRFSIGCMT
ncbi:MAG: hypothetical protein ACREBG_29020, partial [Pyrinomonadaceae bacterium]